MTFRSLTSVFLLCVVTAHVPAATVLFDFESDDEVRAWHDEGRKSLGSGKQLDRVERFATSGRSAMEFFTAEWKEGMPRWPAFECKPPVTDWSKFDRLVMDVTNLSPAMQRLSLFISDSKKPTREGLSHGETLLPLSHCQVVIELRNAFRAKGIDPQNIHVMHFFTAEPPKDMRTYLDRIVLLEPGESLPTLPKSYFRQFAPTQLPAIDDLRNLLEETRNNTDLSVAGKPRIKRWASESLAALERQVTELETRIARADPSVLNIAAEASHIRGKIEAVEALLAFRKRFEAIRRPAGADNGGSEDVAVAFATSMEKILPTSVPASAQVATRYEVRLARNEEESFQVLVVPFDRDLKQAEIRVSDLQDEAGNELSAANVDTAVVGYVKTESIPPYGTSHVGWWPDPILDFQSAADVARHTAQAFWIRVHAPKGQKPGLYEGKMEVVAEGEGLFLADLAVRVYGFDVPDASPLPLAVTFAPHDHPLAEERAQQAKWRSSEEYPINAWKKHKLQWGDFLADYYFTYDSLYSYGGSHPDFAVLERLDTQGRLGAFNLGYYGPCKEGVADVAAWKEATLPRLQSAYDTAKSLGILDHAYIYGCDEAPEKLFPNVERAASLLKEAFPDVPIMTTTYDHSYGEQSVIKSVDAWCPLTPRFDTEKAATARAHGKQVWWYICCGPHHPHANMFIEYPAIEGRLLMGVMTSKYRPDGFLYYQISIWNSQAPIDHGPFTDWNPRSWTTYHGDGAWTCVGPEGTPLATIRLENFRDGLEDYAYAGILEATIAKVEASPELRTGRADWLKDAKALLTVPSEVVKSLTEYTRDPSELYQYRHSLAEAIESAQTQPAYPWPLPH